MVFSAAFNTISVKSWASFIGEVKQYTKKKKTQANSRNTQTSLINKSCIEYTFTRTNLELPCGLARLALVSGEDDAFALRR